MFLELLLITITIRSRVPVFQGSMYLHGSLLLCFLACVLFLEASIAASVRFVFWVVKKV